MVLRLTLCQIRIRAINTSGKNGNRALHTTDAPHIGLNTLRAGECSNAARANRPAVNRGGSPKFESRLVGVSVIESKIPGLPPRLIICRANFVSDFRHVEVIADVRVARLSSICLADNQNGRLIVSEIGRASCRERVWIVVLA